MLALTLLCGTVGVTINDPKCTKKTFPTYFDALEKVSDHRGFQKA
jgi:5-enolpyruvylshikimate-3-phosphate synthase